MTTQEGGGSRSEMMDEAFFVIFETNIKKKRIEKPKTTIFRKEVRVHQIAGTK